MKIDPSLRLAQGEYFPEPQKKDLVVLHFTAGGSARSAFNSWKDGGASKVATAYLVDLDGTIYDVFPENRWAYHLGVSIGNAGHIQDKRSIGIEIANFGPLRPSKTDPDQLCSWPKDFSNPFCRLSETERYVKADYRGEHYFAAFPDAQVVAVGQLVADICKRNGIPVSLPSPDRLTVADPAGFASFVGICSHQNFRSDKTDIGPAWPWERFVEVLRG